MLKGVYSGICKKILSRDALLELFWNYLMNFLPLSILNISDFRPILVFYFILVFSINLIWGPLKFITTVWEGEILLIANYVTKLGSGSKFWDFWRSKIDEKYIPRASISECLTVRKPFLIKTAIFHLKISFSNDYMQLMTH